MAARHETDSTPDPIRSQEERLDAIAALPDAQRNGEGVHLPCVAASHRGDRSDKSLHVFPGDDGRLGARCHSHHCAYKEIAAGLEHRTGLRNILSGAPPPKPEPRKAKAPALTTDTSWETVEDIAHHVAHRSRDEKLGVRFSREEQLWIRATDTHWTPIPGGMTEVCAAFSSAFRREIIDLLGARIIAAIQAAEGNREKVLLSLVRSVRERIWSNRQFCGELQHRLSIWWPEDYTGELVDPFKVLPTAAGVVEVQPAKQKDTYEARVRPFDPLRDRHRAVAPGRHERGSADAFSELLLQWLRSSQERYWLQRTLGAAMFGETGRTFLCVTGPAGCGKSTFTAILKAALGPLAPAVGRDTFEVKGTHNSELADLIEGAARIALVPEAQNVRATGDLLNRITGGDTVTARRPYAKGRVKGVIRALPVFVGEDVPGLRGMTSGTMERQNVIRFQAPERINPELVRRPEKLANDALAWIIDGAVMHRQAKGGLQAPATIRSASEEAAGEQEPELAWLTANRDRLSGHTAAEIAAELQEAFPAGRYSTQAVGKMLGRLSKVFQLHRTTNGKRAWRTCSPDLFGQNGK